MKDADIVVTNPPFSLLREYIALMLMMNYDKKFIIIDSYDDPVCHVDGTSWNTQSTARTSTDCAVPKHSAIIYNTVIFRREAD